MVKKSKLLSALDAHKGRDYEAEKKKKQVKAAEKRKKQKSQPAERDSENTNGHADVSLQNGLQKIIESQANGTIESDDSDNEEFDELSGSEDLEAEAFSDDDDEPATIPQPAVDEPSASEAEQESDVPLSDLEEDDREDTIPFQRMTINNGPALLTSTARIRLIKPTMRFSAHNTLISTLPPAAASVPDHNDDLTRELEFYRICKTAAVEARTALKKEGIPFTRPSDYFAEMAKSDEQMGKVKRKMHDEAAGKKASSEARALRDAKKFGKAVQNAKLQERAKEKRETLEKIGSLKRSMYSCSSLSICCHEGRLCLLTTDTAFRTQGSRHRSGERSRRSVRENRRRGGPKDRPIGSRTGTRRWETTEARLERPEVRVWGQETFRKEWRRRIDGRHARLLCWTDEGQTREDARRWECWKRRWECRKRRWGRREDSFGQESEGCYEINVHDCVTYATWKSISRGVVELDTLPAS